MKQVKWFDRKFHFETEQNIFPSILERLSGTPLRLEEKLKTINSTILTERINNTWSIKENAGHLIDLEPLWQGRFEDIKCGRLELRPTDLQNTKTNLASHNNTLINELLSTFRQVRQQTIRLLENIDETIIFKSALHPRLKTPMRTIDLFLFVAEHDDHHLARITEITKHLYGL
ncbi:MAG: DinB family protein [Chitinophagaceae bacterium]|nr:DinB family protein [Chitinophagaceae bacterium]